jgi:hypothetical protein
VSTCEGGRTGGHKSLATTSHWQAWSSVLYTDASEVASDSRASRRASDSDCENDRDRDSEIDFVVPSLTGANLYGTTGGATLTVAASQHLQSLAPGPAAGGASGRGHSQKSERYAK